MTYGKLKNMLKVFLMGDNPVPKDNDMILVTLETAYIELANECTALKLLTADEGDEIIRSGYGNTFVRMPNLPASDDDELDIDTELVPAVGRLMASYIAKELSSKAYHKSEAKKVITLYESKVRTILQRRISEESSDVR